MRQSQHELKLFQTPYHMHNNCCVIYVPLILNLWGTLYIEENLYYTTSYHDKTPAWVFQCIMFRTTSQKQTWMSLECDQMYEWQ